MGVSKLPEHFFPQAAAGGDEKSAAQYWDNPNYCAQEKLDGARYIVHKGDRGVRIYSRHISATSGKPVDKTAQLAHIAEIVNNMVPPNTVLDGEICAPGLSSSNLVTTVTGSKPDKALQVQKQRGFLVFRPFDILAYAGTLYTDRPYEERYDKLMHLVGFKNEFVMTLPIEPDLKRELYRKVVESGGEGIILKDMNAPYYQGDRHKSWIKVKKQKTFDVVFMGIELAKETTFKKGSDVATDSRIKGKAGAIKFGQYVSTPTANFKITDGGFQFEGAGETALTLQELGTVSGFDDATRDDITANASVYTEQQRVFEVTAQEQFRKSGALRHPRFVRWRDDKNAVDCVFRKDEG